MQRHFNSSAAFARTYDATKPGATLATSATPVTNAPYTVTITFSEGVSGFDLNDIGISNGTGSAFTTISASEYTVLVTPAAEGEVTVSLNADAVTDVAQNGNTAALPLSREYDVTPPVVTVNSDATPATNGSFTVTFSFSEEVSDFDVNDVVVTNGSAGSFVALSATEYTAVITFGEEPILDTDRKRLAEQLHRKVDEHFIPVL